jgi:hypothetical protein
MTQGASPHGVYVPTQADALYSGGVVKNLFPMHGDLVYNTWQPPLMSGLFVYAPQRGASACLREPRYQPRPWLLPHRGLIYRSQTRRLCLNVSHHQLVCRHPPPVGWQHSQAGPEPGCQAVGSRGARPASFRLMCVEARRARPWHHRVLPDQRQIPQVAQLPGR